MSGERGSAPFVVTLCETMVALVAEEAGPLRYASRFQRRAAGAESNVAIGLARLGVSAGWVSRVGDDEFGRYVCAAVRGEDVEGPAGWDELEQFALHPDGTVQR